MDAGRLKGFLFERIEAARINVSAARKGLDVRSRLTADSPGGGTDLRVDIQVISNGRVVEEIQAKGSENAWWLAQEFSRPKYDGTTRLVQSDMEEWVIVKVVEAVRVCGKLEDYALGQGGMQIAREAAMTGGYATAAGAIFGGALSSVQNAYAVSQGEIGRDEAVLNVKDDTVRSGVRSGATGVLGTVIRHVANRAGLTAFKQANVATAVGAAMIEAGGIVHEYAKGRLPADAVAERLGQTGCTTVAALYLGARTGRAFGPLGAVVGSVAGYLLAASVYQSCVQFIRESSQNQEELQRVAPLGYEAARVLGHRRWEMEGELADSPDDLRVELYGHFADIDRALVTERGNETAKSMGKLLGLLDERLAK